MTSLLVFGMVGLMVGIARTTSQMSEKETTAAVLIAKPSPQLAAPGDFGKHHLNLPAGARIESISTAEGRLFIMVKQSSVRRVIVLDAVTGRIIGEIYPRGVP